MPVAILDDGIKTDWIPKNQLLYDLSVDEDGAVRTRQPGEELFMEHGSTIARIISQYAPDTAFCSLRIFHGNTLRTTRQQLAAALNWCLEKRIPIVHMSAGTSELTDYPCIRPIIARMNMQEQIVIAACSNAGGYCIPACLSGVFCVRADADQQDFSYCADEDRSGMAFRASSRHRDEGEEYSIVANSYAAPAVTAAVCKVYAKYADQRNRAQKIYHALTGRWPKYQTPDFMEDAVFLNESGIALSSDGFFFKCLGQYDSIDAVPKGRPLVWLPKQKCSEGDAAARIKDLQIPKLVYCGQFASDSDDIREDCMVWEAREVLGKDWNAAKVRETNLPPIVMVPGREEIAVTFVNQLCKRFAEEEYACLCVSDFSIACLYGMLYCPTEQMTEIVLRKIAAWYRPDIIFCCSEVFIKEIGYRNCFTISLQNAETEDMPPQLRLSAAFTDEDIQGVIKQISDYSWPDE